MNRIPRTRFVTLMAAAAGVSAGLASMTTPSQAMANTQPTAAVASDTAKAKPAVAPKAAPAKAAPAPAKTTAAPKTPAAAAKPAAKPVVATAGPNNPAPDDACGDEADCRNANGDGRGY